MKQHKAAGISALALALLLPAPAQAADENQTAASSSVARAEGTGIDASAPANQNEVVVTGSRLSDAITTFAGSFRVVGEEEIDTQLAVTRDLPEILSFTVPGLAQGNGTAANVEQSLRGRPHRIFIDGIPISNPLRDAGRDIRLIAPTRRVSRSPAGGRLYLGTTSRPRTASSPIALKTYQTFDWQKGCWSWECSA